MDLKSAAPAVPEAGQCHAYVTLFSAAIGNVGENQLSLDESFVTSRVA
jgi:hypothetical protein